ncbi:MAG: hypothetical protein WCX64_04315 [Candidatus Micrarchaeia archaeon]|jgi:hypothetical protein
MVMEELPNLGGLRKKALNGSPEEVAKAALGPRIPNIRESLAEYKISQRVRGNSLNPDRKEEAMNSGQVPKPVAEKKRKPE